jgi:circadian clock protein KaiB
MKRPVRRGGPFKFRLYIAGDTQNSAHAVANLTALCRAELPDRHDIEIVNVFQEPKRALGDGIFMTPTLIKLMPSPIRRIVGTLSQTQPLLDVLGLAHASA